MSRADLIYYTDDGEKMKIHLHDCTLNISTTISDIGPDDPDYNPEHSGWAQRKAGDESYVHLTGIFSKLKT